jgi:SAM-dependent methyltransferase
MRADASAPDLPIDPAKKSASAGQTLMLAVFVLAIFVSAGLLFSVEPMFTKMVLPRLGGAASVWSVAMVFFQTTLLAGYAYAHLLTRFVPGPRSVVIHLLVLLIACLALPLHIAAGWGRPPSTGEAFWMLGLFAVSIGLPFFALSASGSLLQAWFARVEHSAARDPYFLYAVSNLGSFLALLSYPLLVEPFVRLHQQTTFWSIGFYALIILVAGCGAFLFTSPNRLSIATPADADAAPTWRDAATWTALAAVPSGLLLAVTAHISTDIAAVPLIWVVPLALYLLAFVVAFQRRPLIPHRFVVASQPLFVLGAAAVMIADPQWSIIPLVMIHLLVFFVCALMCHGELARRRPAPSYLTAFYMWIAVGGMVGGTSAGLIAPYVFKWVAEYPLLLVLTILCRPGAWISLQGSARYALIAAGVLMLIDGLAFADRSDQFFYLVTGVLLGVALQFWRMPLPLAAVLAFVFVVNYYFSEGAEGLFVRNFFGVLKVQDTSDGQFRVLWHDTTAHGAERIRDQDYRPVSGRPEPLSEYFDGSAMSQVINMVRARAGGPISYAVIGLGTGTLACWARPEDHLDYYEINPAIVRIARDPTLFTFLSECKPDARIVLGDARLTISDAADASYDIVFVDAFISHAIPAHLLTKEAMALYLRKVKPYGVVVFHVSNPNLELATVVAGIAAANGAIALLNDGSQIEADWDGHKYVATVVAAVRRAEDMGPLATDPSWPVLPPDPRQRVWTDDYSNIVGALLRKWQDLRQLQE